jgi:nucleotide-binding universal stress UspA family protein
MFRHILVPTDLTERTVKALDVAIAIGASKDSQITLLHVIETIAGAEFEEFSLFYQKLEQRAREWLNDVVTRTRKTRGPVDVAIVYGRRTEEVLRFAHSEAIDLIVLASHPVDPSQPQRGLGAMSYKLGILAPCAVLLVK